MANEQKLKEKISTLKDTNNTLQNQIKAMEKDAGLLAKSTKKVDDLEFSLEESKEKASELSSAVAQRESTIKNLQNQLSSVESKAGKVSGDFPKLPTGATPLTEMSLNKDETIQLWKIATKDKANPVVLQIRLDKGKAVAAEFAVLK